VFLGGNSSKGPVQWGSLLNIALAAPIRRDGEVAGYGLVRATVSASLLHLPPSLLHFRKKGWTKKERLLESQKG